MALDGTVMNDASEKIVKTERIELRVTPQTKALLSAAAQAQHTTISEFLLDLGVEAAERALISPRVFYVSDEGWAVVESLLNEDVGRVPDADTIAWLRNEKPKTS
jgi:uncharacterized protein (DUF1778 family)